MNPVTFEGVNFKLTAPPGMADCADLPCVREQVDGMTTFTSCWELTQDELKEIIRSKRVLVQTCGDYFPPMRLTACPAAVSG